MGKLPLGQNFTLKHIKDRDLILNMLRYENDYYMSSAGQEIIRDPATDSLYDLIGPKIIQRKTLQHFGFNGDDDDLDKYRQIFQHYYFSPSDFDKEVLAAVYYFKYNRLLYYTTEKPVKDDNIPDVELLTLQGKPCRLYEHLTGSDNYIIAAFSLS